MTNEEMEDAYFGAFPLDFHDDLIRLIAGKCKDAASDCSVYRKERARSLYPYVRRTQIDENVETLVRDYPDIKAFLRKLGSNNCITELRREFALLTIHKVASRSSKVRPAVQREMLARSSQANFFEQDLMPPDGAILYSQMKYGIAFRFPEQLAFVVVDFPDQNGEIVYSINLLAMPRFASILNETRKETRTEDIPDNLDLNLRTDARNKNKRTGSVDQNDSGQSDVTDKPKGNNPDGDEEG